MTFAPSAGGDIILAAADAVGIGPLFGGGAGGAPPWGLYRQGRSVVACESVLGFDHKVDFAVSDHPLERGSFESFNKVAIPFDVRLIFTAGGTEARRAALLNSLRRIAGDLLLYDAVTPETVYRDVNIVHLDYRRTGQAGAGLLIVAVWCQEIRQTSPSTGGSGSSTAAPSGAGQENGGTVQPVDPSATGSTGGAGGVNDQSFANGGFSPGGAGGFDPNNPGSTVGVPAGSFINAPIPDTAIPSGPGGGGNVAQGEIALEPIDVPAGQ
ncbi:phosphoenolpyruvate carboxylase [Methylobacterium frigidaeris]|uniref:phosphoenolpyruvate carboxylase n=1 Tax=Methylobacterium frigidaeris TaxID=2038277 RepID=UPI001EDD1D3F|nr:phosphoenolpyruvate carboxylase [Methylobacterium frigidaeris]